MTPLVFLDFDGVLNSRPFLERMRASRSPRVWADPQHEIDPAAVTRLNRILRKTGASVVVSSSWRIGHSVEELRSILYLRGLKGQVIGATPHVYQPKAGEVMIEGQERGYEIQQWINENEHTAPFVILDDQDDMAHLHDRLVRTSFDHGLLDEHVDAAVVMLEGGP